MHIFIDLPNNPIFITVFQNKNTVRRFKCVVNLVKNSIFNFYVRNFLPKILFICSHLWMKSSKRKHSKAHAGIIWVIPMFSTTFSTVFLSFLNILAEHFFLFYFERPYFTVICCFTFYYSVIQDVSNMLDHD